ncbi:phenylacetate-CoA oxygenase subunit PaaJ [Cytobacillus depressus]|uniref:Phenylacetate-CoA oxygenase subunit PaaJ n=1 Tax=Cytobacillus depressus TaxID=1602942 RepID=A0A6L3VA53_9BACI|nr:1,2-phenylacetyl-CoA epoxidase subunit PaaD [Cytobacillus depressus]KAB2337695.1 phenylacetate-CoA oxygenase subunit PaaJ [Cytobacillus depressus]
MKNCQSMKDKIIEALHKVKDPEIDTISIVDLGMVENVSVHDHDVTIELLPTFMGCPALDIIRKNVEQEMNDQFKLDKINVKFIYDPPWTSDRISAKGREDLKKFGIAPPPSQILDTGEWYVNCPYCDSPYTSLDNLFGPTACRSILYCKTCKNPFEAMKPVSTI